MGTFASAIRCTSCGPSGWLIPHDQPNSDSNNNVALIWKCCQCNSEMKAEDVAKMEDVVQVI